MLLIHGMWAEPNQWERFVEYFAQRNIKARALKYRKSMEDGFMDYVKEIAKEAKGEIVVGHSMGGLIVQKVAEMVEIKAGICIGSAPPKGIRFNTGVAIHSIRYIPNIIMGKPFKPSYKFARKYLLNCMDERRAKEIYASLLPESPRAALDVFKGIEVDERKVKARMLFIAGKDDRVSPPQLQEEIARKYNARVVMVNGCHWIFDEPHEIGEKIIEFVASL